MATQRVVAFFYLDTRPAIRSVIDSYNQELWLIGDATAASESGNNGPSNSNSVLNNHAITPERWFSGPALFRHAKQ